MAAEFHNTNFTCSPATVVPAGPGYTDLAYQTCGYAGSQIGTTIVNGDDYLAVKYGFYFSHVWRNFGILCLFTVAFVAGTCVLSEIMEWEPDSAGPIQYKNSRKHMKPSKINDEESRPVQADRAAPVSSGLNSQSSQGLTATKSTFTWDNLELSVQVGKEKRKLLDGVSGYCKPGTLTALVGASGAGKSTCK